MAVLLPVLVLFCGGRCFLFSTTQSFSSQFDDASVSTRIRALLIQDPDVNPLSITVATDEGEVFLLGRVSSKEERLKAERHARSIDGVWSVMNHLRVGVKTESTTYADIQLRQKIEARLLRDQDILALNLRVFTNEGEAYLLGRVRNDQERRQAVAVARETEGVREVFNYIKAGLVKAEAETVREQTAE